MVRQPSPSPKTLGPTPKPLGNFSCIGELSAGAVDRLITFVRDRSGCRFGLGSADHRCRAGTERYEPGGPAERGGVESERRDAEGEAHDTEYEGDGTSVEHGSFIGCVVGGREHSSLSPSQSQRFVQR